MNNVNLNSESFERAVYAHVRAMENFGTGDFDSSVLLFSRSVDKLARVLVMQAANAQHPDSQPYTEQDFFNA